MDADPESGLATDRGMLLVVSGPSGSGKSTLIDEVARWDEFPITVSMSVTSRPPRPGEVDGQHYRFVSDERFRAMIERGELLEHAQVHGRLYGTPRGPVEELLRQGRWVLLEIDIQGRRQIRRIMPEVISFFVRAPSQAMYERRIRERGTESEEEIARRMADVREQMAESADYDFQIVNETVPQAIRTFRTLLWGLRTIREGRDAR